MQAQFFLMHLHALLSVQGLAMCPFLVSGIRYSRACSIMHTYVSKLDTSSRSEIVYSNLLCLTSKALICGYDCKTVLVLLLVLVFQLLRMYKSISAGQHNWAVFALVGTCLLLATVAGTSIPSHIITGKWAKQRAATQAPYPARSSLAMPVM